MTRSIWEYVLTADGETINFLITIFSFFTNESNMTVVAPNEVWLFRLARISDIPKIEIEKLRHLSKFHEGG